MDVLEKKSQSLNQTSTGIGHVYRGSFPCDINIKSQRGDPLPPLLRCRGRVPLSWHYSSVTSREHDRKPLTGPLTHPRYSKAGPHGATHFVDKLGDRLRNCHSARMTFPPTSEIQDRYRSHSTPLRPQEGIHSAPLLARNRQFETDKAPILNKPGISTTQTDYRRYDRSELFCPSGFNEEAHRNLPPRRTLPAAPRQPFLHRPSPFVPHSGLNTEYRDRYRLPRSALVLSVPEMPDWSSAQASDQLYSHILSAVPKMYSTENQGYGGNRAVLV
ncbi:hypothetical protein GJAV_G00216920 [Gymnothorax javanicus]|nr:hypothetical protein GJAV_G00216920 [Gymnothorax javanicus]